MSPSLGTTCADFAVSACSDEVPNVRYAACTALQTLAPCVDDATVSGKIRPALKKIADEDDDLDAKENGAEALASLG